MQPTQCQVEWIGGIARQILADSPELIVWGTVTQGTYLINPNSRIVFLSTQARKGPLTINLARNDQSLPGLFNGSKLMVAGAGEALISAEGIMDCNSARTWEAAPAYLIQVEPDAMLPRLQKLARMADKYTSTAPQPIWEAYCTWLASWISDSTRPGLPYDHYYTDLGLTQEGINQNFNVIVQSLATGGDMDRLLETLQAWLGRGPGLTPSGDDLVLGILLAVNRHPWLWPVGSDLARFNQAIIESSRAKTTALSRNLMFCAAQGQADEHLISAWDHLLSGSDNLAEILAHLSVWGSHSGFDTLTGMALVCAATISPGITPARAEAVIEN